MPSASRLSPAALIATVSIGCGVAVSVFFSPKDEYFLGNFAYFWLPQAAIVGLLLVMRAHLAAVAACAVILAAYLAAFGAWVSTLPASQALVWLGYLFSLPGAAIGAFVAVFVPAPHAMQSTPGVGLFAAALTFVGLSINQAVVCATVIHCPL